MSPQIADDAARQMRRPWLGPSGSWRWPFDATFTQWGVGAALTVAAFVPLWRVVPSGLLVLVLGWSVGAWLGPLLAPQRPRRVHLGVAACVWLLAFLVLPSWRVWAFPLPLLPAAPVAAVVAVLIVRRTGTLINHNRPVTYWLALPLRAASGPRAGQRTDIDLSDLEIH